VTAQFESVVDIVFATLCASFVRTLGARSLHEENSEFLKLASRLFARSLSGTQDPFAFLRHIVCSQAFLQDEENFTVYMAVLDTFQQDFVNCFIHSEVRATHPPTPPTRCRCAFDSTMVDRFEASRTARRIGTASCTSGMRRSNAATKAC